MSDSASGGTVHSNNWNSPFPQEQLSVPIGRTSPDDNTFAAYTVPQRSQTHAPRLDCAILFSQISSTDPTTLNLVERYTSFNDDLVHWCPLTPTERSVIEMSEDGADRTVGDREMAIIDPLHGWASETVDDRHSIGGSGAGYIPELYTPSLRTAIKIRSLQPGMERDRDE